MSLIRNFFGSLGHSIGKWPFCFGFASLVIGLALSVGMVKLRLKDYIRDGYTPRDAPSRAETAEMRRFWNASGDPMRALVMIRSKVPGQDMLRLDLLTEAVQLSHFLTRQFSCPGPTNNNDSASFTYADLCAPFCESSFSLELFVDGLSQAVADFNASGAERHSTRHQNLSFPLATVHSFELRLEWFFSGVQLRTGAPNASASLEQRLTNMDSLEMVVLTLQAERSNPRKAQQLSAWELAVFDYLQNQHRSALLDVQVIGVEILDNEMTRDHRENTRFFALGFLAMAVFVALNVFGTAGLQGRLDPGKAAIAAATVLCPLLAIGATYGAISLCGVRTNSFLLILPYLILGIGVDDGFLLMHRWFQLADHVREPVRRLSLVFSEVGPSITVTTLTNVVSFGIGALTPTPEIRLFCFGTALALTIDYALQLTLFCPVMLWSARFEKRCDEKGEDGLTAPPQPAAAAVWTFGESAEGKRRKYSPSKAEFSGPRSEGKVMRRLLDGYCVLLTNRWFAMLALVFLVLYWAGALFGAANIQTRLDVEKILPRDSKMRETSRLLNQLYWANHLAITVLVNGPLDVSSADQMARFWAMVRDFEQMPRAKGAQSSLVWLRDYEQFFWGEDNSQARLDDLLGEFELEEVDTMRSQLRNSNVGEKSADPLMKKNATDSRGQQQLDLCRLDRFLDLPFYAHWTAFLRIQRNAAAVDNQTDDDECPRVSAFVLSFAFRDIYGDTKTNPTAAATSARGWEVRIELMQRWRQLAAAHSQALGLAVTVFEENAMFVDQMLSLRTVTLQSGLLTLACMALVCALFIPNPVSVLLASASICSISIGVFGFLAWFRFDLDPVTMAATLMSVGLSVDFTAHVVYHFRQDYRIDFRRDPDSETGFSEQRIPLESREDKLRHTLESVGWPMLQSGISTALCILPLSLVHKYAPTVFVHAVFLVCGWGLVHGLVLVPCLLCLLPSWCTSNLLSCSLDALRGLCAAKGEFRVRDAGERKPSMEMAAVVKSRDEEAQQQAETVLTDVLAKH